MPESLQRPHLSEASGSLSSVRRRPASILFAVPAAAAQWRFRSQGAAPASTSAFCTMIQGARQMYPLSSHCFVHVFRPRFAHKQQAPGTTGRREQLELCLVTRQAQLSTYGHRLRHLAAAAARRQNRTRPSTSGSSNGAAAPAPSLQKQPLKRYQHSGFKAHTTTHVRTATDSATTTPIALAIWGEKVIYVTVTVNQWNSWNMCLLHVLKLSNSME